MNEVWAKEFNEIPATLTQRPDLRESMLQSINHDTIPGKALEGDSRLEKFRKILSQLVLGNETLPLTILAVEQTLARDASPHAANNKVFSVGWGERLVRVQLSRFYNQAVMECLQARGKTRCHVPHSSQEDSGSKCSQRLAGQDHDLAPLYAALIAAYRDGVFSNVPKIPDHPHCSHVVIPVE